MNVLQLYRLPEKEGYINNDEYENLYESYEKLSRMLSALKNSLR
jgi:hypothetical protein